MTLERRGQECEEVFAVVLDGQTLGVVHSELVATTIKAGIEAEFLRREAA